MLFYFKKKLKPRARVWKVVKIQPLPGFDLNFNAISGSWW